MNARIKLSLLAILKAYQPDPMPERNLITAVQENLKPAVPTLSEIGDALKDLEAGAFVAGATDELTRERVWVLTAKGILRARQ